MTIDSSGASAPVRRLLAKLQEIERDLLKLGLIEPAPPAKPSNRKKLGKTEVKAIREMARQGIPYRDIARSFAVHHTTVSRTVSGVYHSKGTK